MLSAADKGAAEPPPALHEERGPLSACERMSATTRVLGRSGVATLGERTGNGCPVIEIKGLATALGGMPSGAVGACLED